MNEPKISFCLITKNEEEVIDICLNSIKNIASEIIVLDTGSTDKTKEIASNYNAKIFDYKWENDFSKARNLCISKANYEWIFIIDADEELTNKSQEIIFDFIKNLKKSEKPYIIQIKLIDIEKSGKVNIIVKKSLFQKNKNLTFIRPVHEHIVGKNTLVNLIDSPIELLHNEYKKSKNNTEKKHISYIQNLEKIIESEKIISEKLRYLYLMGISYEKNNNYDKAIETYQQAILLYDSSNEDKKLTLYTCLNVALIQLLLEKDINKVEKVLFKLLDDFPNNPEYIFYMANLYQIKNDFKKAIFYYEKLINIFSDNNLEKNLSYKIEENLFFYTMFNLGRLYLVIDLRKSIYFLNKAYNFSKTRDLIIIYTLSLICLSKYKEALNIYCSFFNKNIDEINYFKNLNEKDIRFKNFIIEFLFSLKSINFNWYKEEIELIEKNIEFIKNTLLDISVCLITENNQNNIKDTINKLLSISKNIFVIDKNSIDNTVNIARKFTRNIFITEYKEDYIVKNLFINNFHNLKNVLFLKANYNLNNDFLENIVEFLSILFKENNQNIISYIKHNNNFIPSIIRNLNDIIFIDDISLKYKDNTSCLEVFTNFEL